jgi:hypothetical protein
LTVFFTLEFVAASPVTVRNALLGVPLAMNLLLLLLELDLAMLLTFLDTMLL